MIRELFPSVGIEIEPATSIANERRDPPSNRPWVMTNMITTLDGAIEVDGRSGQLGGPADLEVFRALRSVADVIIVGAATAIAEDYKPPPIDPAVAELRRTRGQSPRPTIAVVTRSLDIDPSLGLFGAVDHRPLILTVEDAPSHRRATLETVADVLTAGSRDVELSIGLGLLRGLGHRVALVEGGPSLNGQFIADDLIDEWNLTLSPLLIGGRSTRPAHGPMPGATGRWNLTRLWQGDDLLLGSWRRPAANGADAR